MNSMTGYGRATCEIDGRRLVVEVRSLNHRFFDLKLRVPWADGGLEVAVQAAIRKQIERGALTLTVRDDAGGQQPEVRVNVPLAKRYHQVFKQLAQELGHADLPVTLELLVGLRDVVVVGESERSGEELFEALRPGVDGALAALRQMRQREGAVLARDLLTHTAHLGRLAAAMRALVAEVPEQYRKRLEERIARVLSPGEADPQRLAQEVAILADRTDVSEELVRFGSHLAQLDQLCRESGPVGRKLDFVLQELNRETNTIGSKAQNAEIANLVVEAKATLEKMREQVQNVE
jgi:uncharacterized protein (TIGR00255 family)